MVAVLFFLLERPSSRENQDEQNRYQLCPVGQSIINQTVKQKWQNICLPAHLLSIRLVLVQCSPAFSQSHSHNLSNIPRSFLRLDGRKRPGLKRGQRVDHFSSSVIDDWLDMFLSSFNPSLDCLCRLRLFNVVFALASLFFPSGFINPLCSNNRKIASYFTTFCYLFLFFA